VVVSLGAVVASPNCADIVSRETEPAGAAEGSVPMAAPRQKITIELDENTVKSLVYIGEQERSFGRPKQELLEVIYAAIDHHINDRHGHLVKRLTT
jgi:hypothetical protein